MPKKRSAATPVAEGQPAPTHKPKRRASRGLRAIGLAGFDFAALNQQYRASATPSNDASRYGVAIQSAAVTPGAPYWKAIGIHHLTPDENRSRHNIFVDVLHEDGQRAREQTVGWTWDGSNEPPKTNRLDKPDSEPGTDIPIFGSIFRVWVQGGEPSDVVTGLHYQHGDEPNGAGELFNTFGHHSFYVVFQRVRSGATSQPGNGNGDTVTVPPLPVAPLPSPTGQWIGVTVDALNVRNGPGVEHVRLGGLDENSEVQVVGQEGEWLRILWNGSSAFVNAKFVVDRANAAQLPANRRVLETWQRYRALLEGEAARLGIDPAVALAVLIAESNGAAFVDGRLIIRFENHIFYDSWGQHNEARFREHFAFDANSRWEGHFWRPPGQGDWQPCHSNQAGEWLIFDFARTLDPTAALLSISMGAPQIMGFNHQLIGYPTPQAMFDAFQQADDHQIRGLFRFIEARQLQDALRQNDLHRFAAGYNGPGQAATYAAIIQRNLAAFQMLTAAGARQLTRGTQPIPSVPALGATADWQQHLLAGLAASHDLLTRVLQGLAINSPADALHAAQIGVTLHSYWAQLAWIDSAATAQSALPSATDDALNRLRALAGGRAGDLLVETAVVAALTPPTLPVESGREARRQALCIGIDTYAQSPLSGCVADAELWAKTLVGLGFEPPQLLRNQQATRAAIIDAVRTLVANSLPGDVLVIQYAGHGTQLADVSGDESGGDTPEKDEALVPFDYLSGAYVLDDDLGAIFSSIPAGVNVTCFMDCCHSGSISRDPRKPGEFTRLLVADATMLAAHRQYRQLLGSSRSPKRDLEAMAEVVFSACQSTELAWESAGQGEFTLRATGILGEGGGALNHAAFMQAVTAAFGASPRQNPLLECASAARERLLLQALAV